MPSSACKKKQPVGQLQLLRQGAQPLRCAAQRVPPGRHALPLLFFFNDTATTEIYTLSLHDALPSSSSGKPRGQAGLPLIAPGKDYVVTLRASARNGTEWSMLDRLEITSVTWSDGLVEGDPKPAADTRIVDSGTARQLSQIVPIFRAAAQAPEAHPIPKLRDDIAALSITVNSAGATADAQSLMRIGM